MLTSHHGGFKLEGHLYPYPSRATLDSKIPPIGHVQWDILLYLIYMPYQYLRTTWLWEQPIYMVHNDLYLIIAIVLVIAYRLVVNQFKDYMINFFLSIKVVLKTSSQYRSSLENIILWWKDQIIFIIDQFIYIHN